MKIIFIFTAFFISLNLFSKPDPDGYNKYIKENAEYIKQLNDDCNNSIGKPDHTKKCNKKNFYILNAECKFELNPDACAAINFVNKKETKK